MPRLAALIFVVLGTFFYVPTALAADGDFGWQGPSFSGSSGSPSGSKPESKLWWHDGIWWGSMWDSASSRFEIFKLNRTTHTWSSTDVPLDTRGSSRADTLFDGSKVYVASHIASDSGGSGGGSYLYRLSYVPATKTWSHDFSLVAPPQINNWKTETLAIEKDSTGQLWAVWTQQPTGGATCPSSGCKLVYINRTTGDDATWGTPFIVPGSDAAKTDDIASLVTFGGNKLGVMWSNQRTSKMMFVVHNDADADGTWQTPEVAVSGASWADDHINLKSLQSDGSNRVFAAVKTSLSGNSPLNNLLVRSSGGSWTTHVFGISSGDSHTRPIVLLDSEHNELYMFATSGQSGGTIYYKKTPLNNINFPSGKGTPFIRDVGSADMNNATSTKQNLNSTTGLVVLATNDSTRFYWHNEMDLGGGGGGGGGPTAAFSASTTSGTAPLQVTFTDESTGGATSWAWDFQDDGSVDSTQQNPTFTYNTPGTYSVKLTVSDGTDSDVELKTAYITVNAAGGGSDVTFTPAADTFVRSPAPTETNGTQPTLRVYKSGTNETHSYLRFVVSGLTAGVQSVKLRLFVNDASTVPGTVYAVANTTWPEATTSWSNKPAIGSAIGTIAPTTANTWVETTLTGHITGNGTFSIALANSNNNTSWFSSREGANAPQLVVTQATGGGGGPTAAFSATPTSGTAPLQVTFTDESTGSPTSWAWDFQNNGSVDSNDQSPTFTYTNPGTYSVKLTVSDGTTPDDEIKLAYITVTPAGSAPTAAFSASPTSGTAPLQVTFTDQSTGGATAWEWDFQNDGTVDDTTQSPTFTYPDPGTYNVRLKASNTFGFDEEIKNGYITVGGGGGGTATLTFTPDADTFARSNAASETNGSLPNLRIYKNGTTETQSFLRFTLAGITGAIQSIKLRLFVVDTSTAPGTVFAVGNTTWPEATTNWSNKPALGSALGTLTTAPAANTWIETTLTGHITGNGTFSIGLANGSSNTAWFSSKEGANAPELVVTYTP